MELFLVFFPPFPFALHVSQIELSITHYHVFLSHEIKKQLINQCSDNSPDALDMTSTKNIIISK